MTEATARRLTLVATVLGSSLAFIDATVVNVALPVIQRDLDLGLTGQEWVYLAYSLALASLYLAAGATGDRWGRRRVFTWGVIGFASASALAGAAPDGGVLAAATLGGLTFAMVQGSEHGFAGVWWAFALSAAAAAAFVVVERRSKAPLLPFELFRRRNFAGANLETFLVYATLGGFFLYLPI